MVAEIVSWINIEHIRAAVGRDCRCRGDRSRDSRTNRFAQPPTHAQRTSTHSSRHNSNFKLLRSKPFYFLNCSKFSGALRVENRDTCQCPDCVTAVDIDFVIAIDLSEYQNFRICRILAGSVCSVKIEFSFFL